jgi:hypothetical protein
MSLVLKYIVNYTLLIVFAVIFCCLPKEAIAFQNDTTNTNASQVVETKPKVEVDAAAREELHRYMGYEDLLPKYLSLPYDISMNTNIGGLPFIDISFLFLMFLPLILFFTLDNKIFKIVTGLLLTLFLIIGLSTGYSAHHRINVGDVESKLLKEMEVQTFSKAPISNIKLKITYLSDQIYQVLQKGIIEKVSGEGDAVTYIVCLLLFGLFFYITRERIKKLPKGEQAFVYFGLIYGFLWLILGAGIIWYGVLLLPLGFIYVGASLIKRTKEKEFLKISFLAMAAIWLFCSVPYRFSNYNLLDKDAEELSKGAIHAGPLLYGLGKKSESELLEFLYPGYQPVLEELNANPQANIYRVGTYFQYFINRNDRRIFEDNVLVYFTAIWNGHAKDRKKVVDYLKARGFKYLIIDSNVATIDRTPDGSLRNKALGFQEFIKNNPYLEFIGTDAIVETSSGQRINHIYGKKLIRRGTFTAFRIRE